MSQIFGASVKRREDPRYIQGYGHYTEDIAMPRLAHAVFLRSPYAHAKIRSIKTEKAKLQPGVLSIFTGKDAEGKLGTIPTAWPVTNANIKSTKYPALAIDIVRYVGDPAAVVVAQGWGERLDAL